MELRDFAERILWGNTLEEKLLSVEGLTDKNPGLAFTASTTPSRPKDFPIDAYQKKKVHRFPKAHQLHQERSRGEVLHFFANHELLAFELMALALLKFPQAPRAFRRGVAQTLQEEQKHFLLYLQRMKALGVSWGEVPLNGFFWNTLATMQEPLDYVIQMSLTLEQANLDYASYYQEIFQQLGDPETAHLLETIHQEEIGHVKFGLLWFRRWKAPQEDDWSFYQKKLPFPLTPRRAKGIRFYPAGRIAAGLSSAFIQQLAVYQHSKGRPGTLWYFYPFCEHDFLCKESEENRPRQNLLNLQADLASLLLFLGSSDDTILTPCLPSLSFLESLQNHQIPLPEWRLWNGTDSLAPLLTQRKFSRIEPWGWSPVLWKRLAFLRDQTLSPEPWNAWSLNSESDFPRLSQGFSKAWAVQVEQEFRKEYATRWSCFLEADPAPRLLCHSLEEVKQGIEQLQAFFPLVLKGIYSASGQERILLKSPVLEAQQHSWILKQLKHSGVLLLEAWLERLADFSVLFQVLPSQETLFKGFSRFWTEARGQYAGHFLGNKMAYLPPPLLPWLYGRGDASRGIITFFEEIAQFVGKKLNALGFNGLAGVDTFLYRSPQSSDYAILPILEINPRPTMGHIALALEKKISPNARATWLPFSLKKRSSATETPPFRSFAEALQEAYPTRKDALGRWIQGVLFTNDPTQALQCLTCLIVGHSEPPEALKKRWSSFHS
jgi:uncharacterized ferritin-like protein (DUF455 family)